MMPYKKEIRNGRGPEIIFLFPDYQNGIFPHHLGVSYIIAYLQQKGIYSEQFLNYQPTRMDELLKQILNKNPKIIGFTCYDKNYFIIKLLSKYIKSLNPKILIVTGGPTATFSDKVILKNIPEVDLCVRGEGEYAIYEIINQLKSDKDFSKISGITYRCGSEIVRTIDRPLMRDENNKEGELDIIPSPYLSGIIDPYQLFKNNDRINLLSSRGCIYKCTYCNFTIMSRHTIRYHSIKRVISELKVINKLSKYKKLFTVVFSDDNFAIDKQRVEQICQYIIKEKIDLNIHIITRANHVNQEILKLLFKAGIRIIGFGLESAVPKVLYNIKKVRLNYNGRKNYFKPERKFIQMLKKNIGIAKKIGFKVCVSVIFGLPGETFRDGLKTIKFVKKLTVDGYYHNFLNIFAGTALFDRFAKNKSDTSESRFKFPLNVSKKYYFPYNILKIPIYEKEVVRNNTNKGVSLSLTASLMGLYKKDENNNYIHDVICLGKKIPIEWLTNNCFLQSRITFGINMRNLPIQKENKLKIYVLKLSNFFSLQNYKKHVEIKKIAKNYQKRIFGSYYLFKKYTFFSEFIKKLENNQETIFSISDELDIEELERLLAKGTISSCESYTKGKFNYFLLDSCRWLNFCPAKKLKRLIIDKNYNIFPCFQGKIIGKVGDTLGKIRNNYIKYWRREKEKRGCDNCYIKNNCSQCPFVVNIGNDRYCEIKKKYSSIINKFINLLQFKKEIKFYLNFKKYEF